MPTPPTRRGPQCTFHADRRPSTYGQQLVWTPTPCSGTTMYEVNGHATPEAAWDAVARWAAGDGWTPPRWWQWWRWHDTTVPAWYVAHRPATHD